MRNALKLFVAFAILAGAWARAEAEDGALQETQGIEALKLAQTQPGAIVTAALAFGKAAELYDAAHNDDKVLELEGYLYWCKKKMTPEQTRELIAHREPATESAVQRVLEIDKEVVEPTEAPAYLARAEAFAKANAGEPLLIAVRYYEVADRFKGSDVSFTAQDRSLQAMTQAQGGKTALGDAGAKIPAAPAEPPPPGKKFPVPPADKQAQVEKSLREIFKDEFAKTAPADKLELAAKLSHESEGAQDSVERYTMLLQTATLAAQAANLDLFLEVHEKLAAQFETDPKNPKKFGLGVLIGASRDAALTRVALALKVLEDKPNDPVANQTVGKYFFVTVGKPRGLAYLTKTVNADLRRAAELDVAAPEEAPAQAAAGDAWWELAEKTTDKDDKRAYVERAVFWYSAALPKLAGLNKVKVEKRMAAAAPQKLAASTPAGGAAAPSKAAPPVAAERTREAATTENGTIAGEELTASKAFGPGVFKIAGTLKAMDKSNAEVTFAPGTLVTNGTIEISGSCTLRAEGTEEKPIIFRNVTIAQDLGGIVKVHGMIFDNCTFKKTGGWFAYFSSRWRMYGCTLYKCTFPNLNGVDYGLDLHGCTFISMKFPEIKHKSENDYEKHFRGDWNQIGGCCFFDCQVPPTVFCCSEQCSYLGCRFIPGMLIPMDKEWHVEALVVQCSGPVPAETAGVPMKVVQTTKPYPGPFPPLCNLSELAPAYRQISDMHRGYKWISKDATYTLSSQESVEPSPRLLNGKQDMSANSLQSFHTRSEDAPFIVIDLGTKHPINALDIQNRSDALSRAKSLTAWVGDEATGPWTQIWANDGERHTHWEIVLDKPQLARYVKLGLTAHDYFHLNEVRIFEKK